MIVIVTVWRPCSLRKARLRSYEKLLAETVDSRDAERVHTGSIAIVPGSRLGNRVLSAESVSKGFRCASGQSSRVCV